MKTTTTTVKELFAWYFDLFSFNNFSADLLEDIGFASELVDNGTFEDYEDMAEFITCHEDDKIDLTQTSYTDLYNQEFTIAGVKFKVDATSEF